MLAYQKSVFVLTVFIKTSLLLDLLWVEKYATERFYDIAME